MKFLDRISFLLPMLISVNAFEAQAASEHHNLACKELLGVFTAFQQHHYMVEEVTPEIAERTARLYLESLDPSRVHFLAQEVSSFTPKLKAAFQDIQGGNCRLLSEIFSVVEDRAKQNTELARKILGPKYALDKKVEIQLDPEKRGYPKSESDRQALVKKLLHFQMSNYLMSGLKEPEGKKQLIHRYELVEKRLAERRDRDSLPELYAEAFAQSLDPHSSYMSTDTLEDFQIHLRLSLEGIGAALSSQAGFTVIESLIPGGSAEKSGKIKPKDKVIAVAQEGEGPVSVIDMSIQEVVKLIRGKKGTKVTLTVLREESKEAFEVSLIRDKIDVKEQAAKLKIESIEQGKQKFNIGVIELQSFYGGGKGEGRSSYDDMRALLQEAKSKGVQAIVLDLSKNGGGLLEEAVRISGLFLRKGAIVATKDSYGRLDVLEDEDSSIEYAGPLVALVSRASASASEILVGALKDYHRAVIVGGESTFGKGTVQALLSLPPGLGAIKVTTGMFFVPGGQSTQQIGVSSDILIPSLYDAYDFGERKLENALKSQKIQAFLSKEINGEVPEHFVPLTSSTREKLSKLSKSRVENSKEFNRIRQRIQEIKKEEGILKLKELHSDSANAKKEESEIKEAEQLEQAVLLEAVHVAGDLAQIP